MTGKIFECNKSVNNIASAVALRKMGYYGLMLMQILRIVVRFSDEEMELVTTYSENRMPYVFFGGVVAFICQTLKRKKILKKCIYLAASMRIHWSCCISAVEFFPKANICFGSI